MFKEYVFFLLQLLLFILFIVRVPIIEHEIPILPLLADLFLNRLLPLLYLECNIVFLLHDLLEESLPFIFNLLLVKHVLIVFLKFNRTQMLIRLLPLV